MAAMSGNVIIITKRKFIKSRNANKVFDVSQQAKEILFLRTMLHYNA